MIFHYCFVCLFPKGYVFEDISNVACLDFIDVPIIFRLSCLWHVSRSVQNQVILFVLLSDFPRSISSRSCRSQILLFHLWLLFHHRNCKVLILNATLTILDVPRCISIGIDICCYTVTIEFKFAVCYLLVWFTFCFSILVTGLNNLWYNVYWTVPALCTSFLFVHTISLKISGFSIYFCFTKFTQFLDAVCYFPCLWLFWIIWFMRISKCICFAIFLIILFLSRLSDSVFLGWWS
jgi:hypothetical protein